MKHIFLAHIQSSSRSSEPDSTSPKVKKAREKLMVEGGNGETQSSSEASSDVSAATAGMDGNPPEEQELPWRNRAHTSPDTLNHFKVNRPPRAGHHVRFSQQIGRGNGR